MKRTRSTIDTRRTSRRVFVVFAYFFGGRGRAPGACGT